MASISKDSRKAFACWRVRWFSTEAGRRVSKYFTTEDAGRAFMATISDERPHTKRRRSADDLLTLMSQSFDINEDGCWVWTKTLTPEGYATLNYTPESGRKVAGGHRIAYHLTVEPVPVALVMDHLCRNRACINPDHLEPVVQRENIMRSPIAQGALNARKTHCAKGHAYSPENTYVYRSKKKATTMRVCRECQSEYAARRYSRIAQARKAEVSA